MTTHGLKGRARSFAGRSARRGLVPVRRVAAAAVDRYPSLGPRTARWSWLWQPQWSRRHLERFYADAADPFGFDREPGERTKYELTLGLLPDDHYARALEIGSGEGSFTELLVDRCDAVVGVELSEIAVARACERLAGRPEVTFERRAIPFDLPEGTFDLVVASDVLYYMEPEVFDRGLPRIADLLRPDGVLVIVHFCGDFGAPLSGDEVHDRVARTAPTLGLERRPDVEFPYRGPRDGGYRADVYVRFA